MEDYFENIKKKLKNKINLEDIEVIDNTLYVS